MAVDGKSFKKNVYGRDSLVTYTLQQDSFSLLFPVPAK